MGRRILWNKGHLSEAMEKALTAVMFKAKHERLERLAKKAHDARFRAVEQCRFESAARARDIERMAKNILAYRKIMEDDGVTPQS